MVARYYQELLNFLSRSVKNRDAAADLTQESYARMYAAQQEGQVIRDPRALLYRTARNLAIDHERHNLVRAGVEQASTDNDDLDAYAGPRADQPEVALSSRQGVAAMIATIDGLPPRCREAFMLNRFDGLTYAQVAEHMGISVKMVELHIRNALAACARSRAESEGPAASAAPRDPRLKRFPHD